MLGLFPIRGDSHAGQHGLHDFMPGIMVDGSVTQVSADANESPGNSNPNNSSQQNSTGNNAGQLAYRTLISLHSQILSIDGDRLELTPGMQVAAEIKLGDQTVLEYLLSPVRKAFHEAGRER